VQRSYTLIRPVFGFREETGEVIKIPAGTALASLATGDRYGLGLVFWGGERIMVFHEDLVKNGLCVERREVSG